MTCVRPLLTDWFIPGGDFVRGGSDHFDLRLFSSSFFFFLLAFVFRLLVLIFCSYPILTCVISFAVHG